MILRWGSPSGTVRGFRGVFARQIGGLGAPQAAATGGFRGVFMRQIGGLGNVTATLAPATPVEQYGGRRHYRPLSPYERAQRQQALEREQAAEAKREQARLAHTATIHSLVRGEIQTAIENDEAAIILLLLS